jgi:hypothetical protein
VKPVQNGKASTPLENSNKGQFPFYKVLIRISPTNHYSRYLVIKITFNIPEK